MFSIGPMLAAASVAAASVAVVAFSPAAAPATVSRPCVRTESPLMLEESSTRRELFARAGAAVFGLSAVQSASAKAGQFSKIDIFSLNQAGGVPISSPYQAGGPKAGPESTFGFQKTAGEFVAKGYAEDVTREKKAFEVSCGIITSQGGYIKSKTWWLVRDNLRGQAYTMKENMMAINAVMDKGAKKDADAAYKKFWSEIDQLDLACKKKELALAEKEYDDVLAALKAYQALI